MGPNVKFFVCGVRRSGTTLIRTTLDNHPQIKAFGEAFVFTGRFKQASGDPNSYQQYLNESRIRQMRDLVNRAQTVEAYLDDLYSTPGYKAVGFKLMLPHAREFPMVLEYLKHHKIRAIHVVRKNVLKTLVSRTVKKTAGIAHTKQAVSKTTTKLRTHRLLKDLGRIQKSNEDWAAALRDFNSIQVVYEDFVKSRADETRRMFDFLEVEPLEGVKSQLVKLNPEDIREVVTNYEEVERTLRGTEFEWCLQG